MTIKEGQPYSFTFEGGFLQFYFSSNVKEEISYFMSNNGKVLAAYRPLFSARWIVVIIPSVTSSLENFLEAFLYAWTQMGMDMKFVTVTEGYSGAEPGGIKGIPVEVGKVAGQTAAGAVEGALGGFISSSSFPLIAGIGILSATLFLFSRR